MVLGLDGLPSADADAELGRAPTVDPGPFTGGGDVHAAFLKLDEDSRAARNLAIAYVLSDDVRYAQTAHDILVAWSRESHPTTLEDYDSPDTGQLQSWGAFSFAYAYDLTRDSGLYTSDESAAVTDYFRRMTSALRGAAERLAADPSIGTPERLPYEWTDELTYRYEDRVIGGTFAMALDLALLGLASQTGDEDTVGWVLEADENPLRADRAVDHALRPENDGDGQGHRPGADRHHHAHVPPRPRRDGGLHDVHGETRHAPLPGGRQPGRAAHPPVHAGAGGLVAVPGAVLRPRSRQARRTPTTSSTSTCACRGSPSRIASSTTIGSGRCWTLGPAPSTTSPSTSAPSP